MKSESAKKKGRVNLNDFTHADKTLSPTTLPPPLPSFTQTTLKTKQTWHLQSEQHAQRKTPNLHATNY